MASIRGIEWLIAILAVAWLCGAASLEANEPDVPAAAVAENRGTAGPDQSFDLSWWSVDGGGATSAGGGFTLTGAVGQPEVGGAHHGHFAFDGGVWSAALETAFFYDGFETGDTSIWSAVVGRN